jgi:hypothetical protein
MNTIQFRELTPVELFPLAYQQDLLRKQSEQFANNIISTVNLEKAYESIPVVLPTDAENMSMLMDFKPPHVLLFHYLKNNWKPLLVVGALTFIGVATYYKVKENQKKRRRPN